MTTALKAAFATMLTIAMIIVFISLAHGDYYLAGLAFACACLLSATLLGYDR